MKESSIFELAMVIDWVNNNRALVRLLAILNTMRNEPPYTRQLLRILREWGYGHEVLEKAEKLGLVKRYRAPCRHHRGGGPPCTYNELTERGLKLLGTLAEVLNIVRGQ